MGKSKAQILPAAFKVDVRWETTEGEVTSSFCYLLAFTFGKNVLIDFSKIINSGFIKASYPFAFYSVLVSTYMLGELLQQFFLNNQM